MERISIVSKLIDSIGYESKTLTLEIKFEDNDGVWQYLEFSKSEYVKFCDSESKGKYFLKHIKGRYTKNRIK